MAGDIGNPFLTSSHICLRYLTEVVLRKLLMLYSCKSFNYSIMWAILQVSAFILLYLKKNWKNSNTQNLHC